MNNENPTIRQIKNIPANKYLCFRYIIVEQITEIADNAIKIIAEVGEHSVNKPYIIMPPIPPIKSENKSHAVFFQSIDLERYAW